MTVRPIAYNAAAGTVDILDDGGPTPHLNTVALSTIKFVDGLDSNPVPDFIAITCPEPGCGSTSTHPIGGGADAPRIQELFVRQIRRMGCPCKQLPPNRPFAVVIAHVKTHVARMDGADRWQAGAIS